jgi:hypothetical protein
MDIFGALLTRIYRHSKRGHFWLPLALIRSLLGGVQYTLEKACAEGGFVALSEPSKKRPSIGEKSWG